MSDSKNFALSEPQDITDKKLLAYLKTIDFHNKKFSNEQQQTMILQAITDYFAQKVSQKFVIGLAYLFDTTFTQDTHALQSVIGGLSEYNFQKVNGKSVAYTKQQIERSFQWAQILLAT